MGIIRKWQKWLAIVLGIVLLAEASYIGFVIKRSHDTETALTEVTRNNEQLQKLINESYDSMDSDFLNVAAAKKNIKQAKELSRQSSEQLENIPNVSNEETRDQVELAEKNTKQNQKLLKILDLKITSLEETSNLYENMAFKDNKFQDDAVLKVADEQKQITSAKQTVDKLPDDHFKEMVAAGVANAQKQNKVITSLESSVSKYVKAKKIVKKPTSMEYHELNRQFHQLKSQMIRDKFSPDMALLAANVDKNQGIPTDIKNKKMVSLTFDDGPNATSTAKVLDILKKNQVKATFFVLGSMVDAHPDMIKRIHDEGHVIGNHSYSHPNLIKLDDAGIKKEVLETNKKIEKITGEEPYLLRPPYGSLNDKVKTVTGMEIVLWNVDSMDWKTRNSNAIIKKVEGTSLPHSIVLMHDIYGSSADSLQQIINYYRSNGYQFSPVDDLIDFI
ncbi:polysaccharide deacetylase family protein [Vagococcus vulneris]|uniref:NodB homology domain-containing protein n=1 Tax=Vagococcus vulneris TaxID=1977869 RepID=A0A429ZPW2_9ENTE|nr:polysaccharide deacetylase family protein [Vagococcus vulneris]RST95698.1 hypothetical protein CBF37_11390 [Vagococcus vulneris]